MGYTTNFNGELKLSRPATEREMGYINRFTRSRRMKRDPKILMKLYDGKHGHPTPVDQTPEGIYGPDGEFFAREDGQSGQYRDKSIIEYNHPPGQVGYGDKSMDGKKFDDTYKENHRRIEEGLCQPGLWCQWELSDSETLQWDEGEKFYYYTEWIKYLINHFFEPWGIKLNGEIEWDGEDSDDRGKIIVKDNVVKELVAKITYIDPNEE